MLNIRRIIFALIVGSCLQVGKVDCRGKLLVVVKTFEDVNSLSKDLNTQR